MTDEPSDEELERRMAARLLGSENRRVVKVEVKRSRSPKQEPERTRLRFIKVFEEFDGEPLWCEVERMGPKGWVPMETYDDHRSAERAADKYRRAGDVIEWWKRNI